MYKPLAALAALCLTACGGNDVDEYNRSHPVLVGSFEHYFAQLHASPLAGACEQRFAALHKELASELDQRRDALERLSLEGSRKEDGGRRWVKPWGPITMDTQPVTQAHRMEPWRYGWAVIEQTLRKAQRTDSWDDWRTVYIYTSALLADERNRHGGLSLGLTDATLPHVEELRRTLDQCLADASCGDLTLSVGAHQHVSRSNPVYARIWGRLNGTKLRSVKRKALRELSDQVGQDLSFYSTTPNEAIVPVGEDLRLPLDAGPFHEVRQDIQRIVEETWRGRGLQVRVEWVSRQQNPGAFTLVPHSGEGRAYVRYDNQTVNLFANVHAKTIAHELGHVLGLPDRYYTRWNEAQCDYHVSIDNDDIMSNHMTGEVTRHEIEILRDLYDLGK